MKEKQSLVYIKPNVTVQLQVKNNDEIKEDVNEQEVMIGVNEGLGKACRNGLRNIISYLDMNH